MENVAVTVTAVAPASSATRAGVTDRLMAVSSSVRVRLVPFTVRSVAVPSTLMVSSPSLRVSSMGTRVKGALPLLAPAGMVTVKSVTAA